MSHGEEFKFDEIGYWSELKLEIIEKYAKSYSQILTNQQDLSHGYIDAFSGAGFHVAKKTGRLIEGSPVRSLGIDPPFDDYFFIDIEETKTEALHKFSEGREDVHIYEGDCNRILLDEVFPRVRWDDFRRGLCLLDPYGLQLNWEVIETAGKMKSIEILLNFPILDINRNAVWRKKPGGQSKRNLERLDAFWGDKDWPNELYQVAAQGELFGPNAVEKVGNADVVSKFRKRLKDIARFKYVPDPIPMRNSIGATIYYLFFASPNSTGSRIIESIFNNYRDRGLVK